MKEYILIQNDGEIETNSFELIGASTKRDEKGKIGFFGSGLKYSIAYMMRKGIEFRVFSGLEELKFTTIPEALKDKSFDRICINGRPTSYTVTMGPTWTKDWFVLREIYCNALDEGSCTLVKNITEIRAAEGKTRIYVELTPELDEVARNWDRYFADERTPLFVSEEVYSCYLGHEDGGHDQKITVYPKSEGVLYRRGIRVYQSDRFLYDYNFTNVNINEDRTAKNPDGIRFGIVNMIAAFVDENYIKSVLRSSQDDIRHEEYYALGTDINEPVSERWVEFSRENMLVVKEIAARFNEIINASTKEVFLIPSAFARKIKQHQPEVSIAGMGGIVGKHSFSEVDKTPKMNFLLKEVLKSLEDMGYHVPFQIIVAEFDNDAVLGQADIPNKKIYLAAQTFDKGRREIAMTLMEETEHIKSGETDETREFQNHIFSGWLKSMEEANGLFL